MVRWTRSVTAHRKRVLLAWLVVVVVAGIASAGVSKLVGWERSSQIEAWIPIFLFAMLFGLSMDYEVFLLSRMREDWDETHDNEHAGAAGLQHTGRIITAAAIIMIAAFAGFTAGRFVGLQEFGLGLSAAILLDATIVRTVLGPAVMRLMGDRNWYLPPSVGRIMRLPVAVPALTDGPNPVHPLPADGLAIQRETSGNSVRVRLTGELDLGTRHRLAAELEQVENHRPELLVID